MSYRERPTVPPIPRWPGSVVLRDEATQSGDGPAKDDDGSDSTSASTPSTVNITPRHMPWSPSAAPATAGHITCPKCHRDRAVVPWETSKPQRIYLCTECKFGWTAAGGGHATCVHHPSRLRSGVCGNRLSVEWHLGKFVYACTGCQLTWDLDVYTKKAIDYAKQRKQKQ